MQILREFLTIEKDKKKDQGLCSGAQKVKLF